MTRFRLDPDVASFMEENGCNELEAANAMQLNLDEIYDVVDDSSDYDFEA